MNHPIYRVVGFENHRDDGPFRHESHEAAEKRPLFVNIIESLRLLFRQVQHLYGSDSEASVFQAADDGAYISRLDGIGFKDCECLFHA